MSKTGKDAARVMAASKEILDGRHPITDLEEVMITLEHLAAAVLLVVMENDPRKAAIMLNEGLVIGVEKRLAWYASKQTK